jgi:hypothetical protein
MRTTKFKPGFQRRRQEDIGHDEPRLRRMQQKEEQLQKFEPKRMDRLADLDTGYNRFNVISGEQDISAERRRRHEMNHVDETKSVSFIREGAIALRDSASRFYGPPPGHEQPPKHDMREVNLITEGLKQPLFSSVLGIGRSEMPSYGVADALTHSAYGGHELGSRPPSYREPSPFGSRPPSGFVQQGNGGGGGGGSQRGYTPGQGYYEGGYPGGGQTPQRGPTPQYSRGGTPARTPLRSAGGSQMGGMRPETGASMRSIRSAPAYRAASARQQDIDSVRDLR